MGVPADMPIARGAVWIDRLIATDFRGYARAELCLDGRPVVLTGPNGAGKTNLLEAVSFLAPGRGLRRARLSEVDRRRSGAPDAPRLGGAWGVAAGVTTPAGRRELGTGRDAGEASERRLVRVDDVPARSQQALAEALSIVWLTPAMDGLFRDGPSGRRRFLDRLVYAFDPAHAGRVAAYEQRLRERARLLKAGPRDAAWLSALEEGMAGHGVAIAAARRDLVARLHSVCETADGAFPAAEPALLGAVESWLDEGPALAAEDRLRAELAEARGVDAEAGGAGVGPHRSDLLVRHRARGVPAAQCSTGEQKALLVGLLLAHVRLLTTLRGSVPLLLLDEVAAHLDQARRAALYETILALGAQVWMTGTDAAAFAPLEGAAQRFRIADARITPLGA